MSRVAIGLPVYNGQRYIEQSLRSILDQTFDDLEVVVADNASTDGTLEIVERLASADDRVRILRSDANRGAAWNYNRALDATDAPYFRWHAHDDWLEPEVIDRLVEALDADDGVVLAHSWTRFVDDDGQPLRVFEDDLGVVSHEPAERLKSVVRRLTYCNAVFGLVRRDVLERTARIAPFPGSDVSLLNELAIRGRFAVVPEPLYVRRPGASVRANPTTKQIAEWFAPGSRARRFPGLHQAAATLGAIRRAEYDRGERMRLAASFLWVWPRSYGGRLKRRARRRARTT